MTFTEADLSYTASSACLLHTVNNRLRKFSPTKSTTPWFVIKYLSQYSEFNDYLEYGSWFYLCMDIYLAASLCGLDSEDDGYTGAWKDCQLCDYSCHEVRWRHIVREVQWRQTTNALPLWQRVFLHIKICWNELVRITCPKENACHFICPSICFT